MDELYYNTAESLLAEIMRMLNGLIGSLNKQLISRG